MKNSQDWLTANVNQHVINLKKDFVWVPYSPDLNPLDYFLGGSTKSPGRLYRDSSSTIEEVKDLINDHIQRVDADQDLCGRIIKSFMKSMNLSEVVGRFCKKNKNKNKNKKNKAIAMMRRKSPRSENIYLIENHCQTNNREALILFS